MTANTAFAEPRRPDHGLPSRLRGFGVIGMVAMLMVIASVFVSTIVAGVLAVVWALGSRTPVRELGYTKPNSWPAAIALGLAGGALFKLMMKSLIMPLLGADPINHAYQYLFHNPSALAGILLYLPIGAGFAEETFFRGYLFERLGKLLGTGALARITTVAATAAFFAALHYPVQGRDGALQAFIVGVVFGTLLAAGTSLFTLMMAHVSFDLVAVAIIYYGWESRIGHAIFR